MRLELRRNKDSGISFDDRVDQAANALKQASNVVAELEAQILRRSTAISELQKQHELLGLTAAQREALNALLAGDARREGRRSLYLSIAAGALFFVAGIGVTLVLG